MSIISNKFYVQAIEDGSTLHAQLLSDKSLSQGYTPSGCVPNWTVAANQPTIYVDLINGTDRVSANAGGTWTYNGVAIDFENDSRFTLLNNYIPSGYTTPVPAIKITGNLASSSNVNTDTIGFSGSYTLGGNDIGFDVTTFVRITGIMSNGIFGQIEFVDGSNIIAEKGAKKTIRAVLFGADGNEIQATAGSPNAFTTQWYLNDTLIGAGSTITVDGQTYYQAMQVAEDSSLGASKEITDNAVIKCVFSYTTTVDGSTATLTYTAYESVDDQTDPEQMYIQTVVSGGGAGLDGGGMELHKNQSVVFQFWMGTMTDSTADTTWQNFYARLHRSDGEIVLTSITGINDVESTDPESDMYGYRQLDWSSANHYATLQLSYDLVKSTFTKYLTGYVKAIK
jgi:hypothetical protein